MFEVLTESLKQRRKVILYNPKALFFDMPLALLALGSMLDPNRFEVVILDGRIEQDPGLGIELMPVRLKSMPSIFAPKINCRKFTDSKLGLHR